MAQLARSAGGRFRIAFRVFCAAGFEAGPASRGLSSQAELYPCEWHLRHALERLMEKIHRGEPQHRAAIDTLLPRTQAAFTGLAFWRPFVRDAHGTGIPRLSD